MPEMGQDRTEIDIVQLVADYHREIYAYAYRLSGSVSDAEDLSQAVFLTAQEKLGQLEHPEKVRAWLYAILRSHFLKMCRKRRPLPEANLQVSIHELAAAPEVDSPIDSDELHQALMSLPEAQRLVLVMYYFEECSYREIAERLELPMGTVMSRLARAKSRLRAMLCEEERPSPVSAAPVDKKE